MSEKRMSWLLCAAFLLALMVLPALAETDEIVLTFGGNDSRPRRLHRGAR